MEGPSRKPVAVAVAILVAGALLAACGDQDRAPSATAADEPAAEPAAKADLEPAVEANDGARVADRRLTLPTHDHPVVWVRQGREADLHASPAGPVVRTLGPETEFGSRRVLSVSRTQGEWAGVPNPFTGNGILGWVRLDPRELRAGFTSQEVVVDLSDHRAELIRAGETIRTFTVTVGAPGTETPTGRFAVTDTFRGDLNPAYGCCAVALTAEQPNLDSGWIGGNRIAIHGTAGPLGANLSHGCIRAADRDVSALVDTVPPGAPVTVRE